VLGLGYEREDEGRANLTNKMGVACHADDDDDDADPDLRSS
jgi:hypothetical protein